MSEAMETMGQSSTPRRSQNAAVGALVEMLKSTPPLCPDFQNPSEFSQNSAMISRSLIKLLMHYKSLETT
jgi:hypothetical protein